MSQQELDEALQKVQRIIELLKNQPKTTAIKVARSKGIAIIDNVIKGYDQAIDIEDSERVVVYANSISTNERNKVTALLMELELELQKMRAGGRKAEKIKKLLGSLKNLAEPLYAILMTVDFLRRIVMGEL